MIDNAGWVLLFSVVVALMVLWARLDLVARGQRLSNQENLGFTALSVLLIGLIGLIAWSGAQVLRSREAEAVWTARRPLAVGQVVQESDLLARRRPSEGFIAECARKPAPVAATATLEASPPASATPTATAATATVTATAVLIPAASPTSTPICASCGADALKKPIPASELVVGRRVVQAIAPGCPITEGHVEPLVRAVVARERIGRETPIAATAVLTETRLLASDVPSKAILTRAEADGKVAKVDLTAGRPITSGQLMDAPAPAPTPVTAKAAIADFALGAYHVFTGTGAIISDSVKLSKAEAEESITSTAALAGQLLLAPVARGKPILKSNVVKVPSDWGLPVSVSVVALPVHGPASFYDELKPGNLVDIYASPRVMTDTEGIPHVLMSAEAQSTLPGLEGALLLAIKSGQDGHEVTLGVNQSQSDEMQQLLALANQVEYVLVRRR